MFVFTLLEQDRLSHITFGFLFLLLQLLLLSGGIQFNFSFKPLHFKAFLYVLMDLPNMSLSDRFQDIHFSMDFGQYLRMLGGWLERVLLVLLLSLKDDFLSQLKVRSRNYFRTRAKLLVLHDFPAFNVGHCPVWLLELPIPPVDFYPESSGKQNKISEIFPSNFRRLTRIQPALR